MTTEQQNKSWACLSKDVREAIRTEYENALECSDLESFLQDFFGLHNLTSDTEPDEVLTILRKDIIEEFNQATADLSRTGNLEYKGKRELLKNLFGDKCIPDKAEEIADKCIEPIKEHFEQPSVHAGPKFKVGDKVVAVNDAELSYDQVMTVVEVKYVYNCVFYRVNEHPALFYEGCLEPYAEENEFIASEAKAEQKEAKDRSLSDKELDDIIFNLIRIRDNRRENDRQLTELLTKLHYNYSEK
ncbi:MAG: hypothetical protein K2G11_06530 [Muribaculaceae bacterium]|nr:hypothetical protein [Muribaculaceae bacterium]